MDLDGEVCFPTTTAFLLIRERSLLKTYQTVCASSPQPFHQHCGEWENEVFYTLFWVCQPKTFPRTGALMEMRAFCVNAACAFQNEQEGFTSYFSLFNMQLSNELKLMKPGISIVPFRYWEG